jgi:hypothetical protein
VGRKAIRTAVAAYFAPPAVAGLAQMTRAKPRNVKSGAFGISATQRYGAIGWVYLEGEHEYRMSAPSGAGQKMVTYGVGLRVDFRSELSDTATAIDAYDDIIEAIKAHLRADPTLGTGPNGVVFQAGEGDLASAPDIEVISDLPQESEQTTTTIRSVVRFLVLETIVA